MCGLGADEDADALGAAACLSSRSASARFSSSARNSAFIFSSSAGVAAGDVLEQARLALDDHLGAATVGQRLRDSSSAFFSSA